MSEATKTIWNQALGSAASTTFGTALGMIFGKSQDKRQINQQRKLQDLQIEGEEKMLGIQAAKEYDMWKKTGPVGQVDQYEQAGLNPALMYGMGGGGGQSMGGGAPQPTGGQAPQGGREVQDAIGMALQLQMLRAQKENIEANTNKTNIEAGKTAGVDTAKVETEIQSLTQGIQNAQAIEQLTKAQTRMVNLQNELTGRTMEDRIEMVNYETKRACQEAQQAVNNTNVSDATIQDKIKIIKREAIALLLEQSLTKAKTALTDQERLTSQTQRRAISTGIEQNWQRGNNEANRIEIDRVLREQGIDLEDRGQILKAITNIMSMGHPGAVITDQSYRPSEHHTHIQN